MRRGLLALAGLLLASAVAAFAARGPLLDALTTQRIDQTLNRANTALLNDGQLHVFLCGTAAALPDPDRAGPCTAILAGGQFLLIDAGPASWRVVDALNLPIANLSAVLVTHLHSDHIGGLGEAVVQSWIAGRATPLDVYGPPGIEDVVSGFAQVHAHDTGYRVEHHGADFMPAAGARAEARVINAPPGTDSVPVFARNGLEVRAFRVEHAPADPAYGYRIAWRGRVVVVSGDTTHTESVISNARGADLLLHEALAAHLTERAASRASELGMARTAKLAHDVHDYHTTPVQAAQIAQAAGAKTLVYTHIFPPLPNAVARHLFLQGTRAAFDGEQVLGEDGMRFDFSPAS